MTPDEVDQELRRLGMPLYTDSERETKISELWTAVWAACEIQDKALATQLWAELRTLMQSRSEAQKAKMGLTL